MKKVMITVMIVAVVAAVHYLLLKKYVIKDWDSKGEIKDEKAVENVDADKSEKDIGLKPQEVEKKNEKPPMEADRPLTYRNAVMGDISGIPSSREATSGILFDASSRNVLWAKNPRNAVPVASMTKIMTELLVFEALEKSDQYNMQTPIKVTRTAYKIGGSQVYLDPKETFPLEELMKCIMISSANDAAQLVAEFFGGGSVEVFVAQMNKRAKELHLSSTRFSNPTGLPANDPKNDNVSSPEAMAFLGERLMRYPKAREWAGTWLDSIRKGTSKEFQLKNHNKLIKTCPGVYGVKTGFINRSGFCVTVACERNGKELIAVVTGFKTSKARNDFVTKLLDWGYGRLASMETASGKIVDNDSIPK